MSLNISENNIDDLFEGKDLIFRFTRKNRENVIETRKGRLSSMDCFQRLFVGKLLLEPDKILNRGYLKNFSESQKSSLLMSVKVNSRGTYARYETQNSIYEFKLVECSP